MKKAVSILALCIIIGSFAYAKLDPTGIADGIVYLFDDVSGGVVKSATKAEHNAEVRGDPKVVAGVNGKALWFDGQDDFVFVPDSNLINTGGPFPNRTVIVVFKADDVSLEKQTLYEEGGRTRGACIYVHQGEVYVGAWNRAEYMWNGAWISAPVESGRWYSVAFVIRDGTSAVEPDKFEMWLNGDLIGKAAGGLLNAHGDDNAIGATTRNVVFHDDDGAVTDQNWFFKGTIDEVWILNQSLDAADLTPIMTAVEPSKKLATSWGSIKSN